MTTERERIAKALLGIVSDENADPRVRVDAARLLLSMSSSSYLPIC
jgi:hypothetical protein